MLSKECAISLLKDAKALVKQAGCASAQDISKELTKRKLLLKCNDVYYNNMFKFCRGVLKNETSKSKFIYELNHMLTFMESFDVLGNCRAFVPHKAKVLSNMPRFSSYDGQDLDFVLLACAAVSPDAVVLAPDALTMFSLAKSRSVPIYAVSSVFSIDMHSVYHPALCFEHSLFDGVISEYGLESFNSFMLNARNYFNWLFF